MRQKERHFAYEGAAIVLAGIFGAMTVPSLMSVRDSFAVICGAALMLGWLCWLGYFTYRLRRNNNG